MAKVKFYNNCGGTALGGKPPEAIFHCKCLKEGEDKEVDQKFTLPYGTKHETVLSVAPKSQISVEIKGGKKHPSIAYDGHSVLLTLAGTVENPTLKFG